MFFRSEASETVNFGGSVRLNFVYIPCLTFKSESKEDVLNFSTYTLAKAEMQDVGIQVFASEEV